MNNDIVQQQHPNDGTRKRVVSISQNAQIVDSGRYRCDIVLETSHLSAKIPVAVVNAERRAAPQPVIAGKPQALEYRWQRGIDSAVLAANDDAAGLVQHLEVASSMDRQACAVIERVGWIVCKGHQRSPSR